MLDVRGGLNYYHNVTTTEGHGLTTSTDVGIQGANLDDYTSGITSINIGGHSGPVLGFSASQPWDRSEKTWNATTTLTRLFSSHTLKFGGEWRHNYDMLLQTQDAGGPRGQFTFNASGTGIPSETGHAQRRGQPDGVVPARLAEQRCTRDLKVFDEPGHEALGDVLLHPGQVAGAFERHGRPRPAVGVLHAARGPRRAGQPRELRSADPRDSRGGIRRPEQRR